MKAKYQAVRQIAVTAGVVFLTALALHQVNPGEPIINYAIAVLLGLLTLIANNIFR